MHDERPGATVSYHATVLFPRVSMSEMRRVLESVGLLPELTDTILKGAETARRRDAVQGKFSGATHMYVLTELARQQGLAGGIVVKVIDAVRELDRQRVAKIAI